MSTPINPVAAMARAMLLVDLLSHRLLAIYCQQDVDGEGMEMAEALETEVRHVMDSLRSLRTLAQGGTVA